MEQIVQMILEAVEKLGGLEGAVLTVLGVLFFIAKAVSNQKAGPVIAKIQKGVDGVAKIMLAAGKLLEKIAELLAKAIQSDGLLGKK
jgi:hypothetical protein